MANRWGREVHLQYDGKEDEKTIVNSIHPANLIEVQIFGKVKGLLSDDWRNMLIYGDNLPVLRKLMDMKDIAGKVRLVYIDPPFATGQEYKINNERASHISFSEEGETAYADTLIGKDYLEFLRKRLILLRELLADDGTIYVHVDCKVGHYVKILMDEIFGEENFINDIARIKCNPKNFKRKAYGNFKDMILFYSKTKDYVWNDSREPYTDEEIRELFPKVDEQGRRYTTNPLHAPGETKDGRTGMPWRGILPPRGRHWRYPPEVLDKLDRQGLIEWSSTGNPRLKIFADEYIKRGKKRQDVWIFKDPPYPYYPTQKNLDMLKTIVSASSNPGDLVLDCFSGSGTTLIAAEALGRRWIGIDNSEVAIEVTIKRFEEEVKNYKPFTLYTTSTTSSSDTFKKVLQQYST